MLGAIVSAASLAVGAVKAVMTYLGLRKQQEITADAQATGAIKQQAADDKLTIQQQREQLEAAANTKGAKDAADKGRF